MSANDYIPSYKALNQQQQRPVKQSKALFMAPVFVTRHESDVVQSDCCCGKLIPTNQNIPNSQRIPKESFTQTSKTILQLAQLEQKKPKSSLKLLRENTLDLCPDIDLDSKEHDEKFSVDSLNLREEPEKENPIHHTKATSHFDHLEHLHHFNEELENANHLRLNQWVENIPIIPTKPSSLEVSVYGKSKAHNVIDTKSSMASNVPKNLLTNDELSDIINLPRDVISKPLIEKKKCMTSFHSLIYLNDNDALTNPGNCSGSPGKCSQNPKIKVLNAWHSQIQYGPASRSSETCMQPNAHDVNTGLDVDDDEVTLTPSLGTLVKPIINVSKYSSASSNSCSNGVKHRSKSCVDVDNAHLSSSNLCASKKAKTINDNTKGYSKFNSESTSIIDGVNIKQVNFYHAARTTKIKDGGSSGGCNCLEAVNNTFMSPTLSSEQKSLKQQVESVRWFVGNKFKGGIPTPKGKFAKGRQRTEIPFTSIKTRAVKSEEFYRKGSQGNRKTSVISAAFSSSTLFDGSSSSCDTGFFLLLNRIKSADFNSALKGLAEIIDTARHTSREMMMPYMTLINQRLLELLKSPRSHVARTACQLTGHFFEVMKDTRRPEFDDIINTLLYKTADASKFIRQDANMALDAMVTHIPVFHAVRSVCAKGPTHRNPLVRCAAVRLIICAVVIAGPEAVMNNPNLETTRKRIIENMGHFLDDRNGETRKYAERLYKILQKEGTFDFYAKKFLNRTKYDSLMSAIKNLCKKSV